MTCSVSMAYAVVLVQSRHVQAVARREMIVTRMASLPMLSPFGGPVADAFRHAKDGGIVGKGWGKTGVLVIKNVIKLGIGSGKNKGSGFYT